ncbi:hypothetical protein [Paraburkholderia sp.]|uniref:hypothetical protein n=1 Tax=Paraburkholderia sp. TaxID=1926495 RepID=UPI002D4E9FF6|nr:hypothetical protein [Paraburkholderia sp.]HZZ04707.1 hypothetical protein [Paraburkholderia sp.]
MTNLTQTASLTMGVEMPDGTTQFTGLELIEVAPGIDIQRGIVTQMGFAPVMHAVPSSHRRTHLSTGTDRIARRHPENETRRAVQL